MLWAEILPQRGPLTARTVAFTPEKSGVLSTPRRITSRCAKDWGVIVLYNGAQGVMLKNIRRRSFRSPWIFNPTTGDWTSHDNRRIIRGVAREYAQEIEPELRTPPPATAE
ncbi:MAG: hypothetical protein ACI9SQ_001409 [Rubritalea sp.]|jgi:hypothetical protein